MLYQMACFPGTVHRDTSKDRITAVMVVGMWQAVDQIGILFQRQRGKLSGHAMDRRPEKTALGKVAQVEGGTETGPTAAKAAAAGALMHCQPLNWQRLNGYAWSAPFEQQAPNKKALTVAMRALGDVHPGELRLESRVEEALDSIKALLGCGADEVHLLFAAFKAVPRHSTLWARASRSRALVPALTALMDPCARNVVPQQFPRISDGHATKITTVHMRNVLARACQARHKNSQRKNVGKHACAKLVSQHQLAPPQTGMNLQAESVLQVLRDDRLHDVLLEAAEREAPSMNSQGVANTVWALAELGMPPVGSLRYALWTATERVAPSMNSQNVVNMVIALANPDMPPRRQPALRALDSH
jgi:hypothetical protein